MDNKINRNIVRRFLDRRNDRLGILQVDVSRDCKAEKAALFLTINHSDNPEIVLLFHRPDRLGTSHGVPSTLAPLLPLIEACSGIGHRAADQEDGLDRALACSAIRRDHYPRAEGTDAFMHNT